MAESSDGSNVVSIEETRAWRFLKKVFKGYKPIEPELDLWGKKLRFSPHVMGEGSNVRMSILVYDVTTGYANIAGVLRVEPEQWEGLKEAGDRLLYAHLDLLKKRAEESDS